MCRKRTCGQVLAGCYSKHIRILFVGGYSMRARYAQGDPLNALKILRGTVLSVIGRSDHSRAMRSSTCRR